MLTLYETSYIINFVAEGRQKKYAEVAEQADAQDLKSCGSDTVPVRFRSSAPKDCITYTVFFYKLNIYLKHFSYLENYIYYR